MHEPRNNPFNFGLNPDKNKVGHIESAGTSEWVQFSADLIIFPWRWFFFFGSCTVINSANKHRCVAQLKWIHCHQLVEV